MDNALSIRRAIAGDAELITLLLRELAEYERLTDKFFLTADTVVRDFFGPEPSVYCDLAFVSEVPVGLMTWYWTYTTFGASRGLYLEDIYVREQVRGQDHGRALFAHLANRAIAYGATHLKWAVLNWNTPSIGFYESL